MARLVPSQGDPLPLDPKTPITIGSGADAILRLDDPGIAEIHCALRALQDGGYGLKDLGSDSGTRVNGRSIRAVRLKHGDRIQVGAQEIVFEEPERAPRPEPAPKPAAHQTPEPEKAPPAPPRARTNGENGDPWLTGKTRIAGYEVHALLGTGGMGRVYETTQLSLHRKVAFKVLDQELAKDPKFVEGFLREARASARFNHPNVVQVFDVDDIDGRPFYSMELLEESLEERLRREGRLSPEDAIAVIADAAKGLAYAEQLGLVHRDVKPDNLMIDKDGRTKLCDLGLAASIEKSHEGKVAGTPHFMSPEQIRKSAMDQRSDLYSLGCTFWRLLTGKNVFTGKTVRDILKSHLETPPPKLREVLPEADEALETILDRLLAKDPDARYAHASDLVEDLQILTEGRQKSHRALAFGLGAVVIVLAVTLIIILNKSPEKEIQVIKQEDPDAARQQALLRERNAEVDLLRVPKTGDLEARALAYEKVAKDHPDTKAGKKAEEQAGLLRKEQADLAAAAAAEKQRIARLAESVTKAGEGDRRAGRIELAWRQSQTAAGDRPRPKKVDLALDQVRLALATDLGTRVEKALTDLRTDLARPDADPVQLRGRFLDALRPRGKTADGQELEWTLPGAEERVRPARELGAVEIRKVVAARADKKKKELDRLLRQRSDLLVGQGGALQLLAEHRYKEAAKALRALPAPKGLEKLWGGILDLAEISEDAEGALAALLLTKDGEGNPRTFEFGDEPAEVASFDGKTLVLEVGKGRRKKKQEMDPWSEPDLLALVLADRQHLPAQVEKGRQALILLLNYVDLLPQGLRLVQGAKNGATPDTVKLDASRVSLLRKTHFDLPAFAREGEALDLLARLLQAWNRKADLQARDAMQRLEASHRTSAVGIGLGIPQEIAKKLEDQ